MVTRKKSGHYIWWTRGDSKVRETHAEREGKVFHWNRPPKGGHPGEDYNCRCRAIKVTSDEYLPQEFQNAKGSLRYVDLVENGLLKDFNQMMEDDNKFKAADEALLEQNNELKAGKKIKKMDINMALGKRVKTRRNAQNSRSEFDQAVEELPEVGTDVYYVSRPFIEIPIIGFEFQSHNFLVYNAKELGDEKATVVSFGQDDNFNLGIVDDKIKRGPAENTHEKDVKFWLSLKVPEDKPALLKENRKNVLLLSEDSRFAEDLIDSFKKMEPEKKLDYVIRGPNSNSAAQAIAELIFWESGSPGPVSPPDQDRRSLGVEDADLIQLDPPK